MAERLILILGGARSGKSTLARDLAQKLGDKVLFVATAEALDTEMALRIEEHKRTRPHNWRAVELNSKVGERLRSQIKDADVVLLDCITLLISNVLIKALNKKHSVVLTGMVMKAPGQSLRRKRRLWLRYNPWLTVLTDFEVAS
jgi:adenosylcobinamide kinase/adenosylcobinamide-phosphate guanylyltransferase